MRRRLSERRKEELSGLWLLRGCSERELAEADGLLDDVFVEQGENLVIEGSPGRETFVIVSGEASVSVRGEEVARIGSGEFFGETAVLAAGPRTATVTALTPMHLLVTDPGRLMTLLTVGNVAKQMLRRVAERQTMAAQAAMATR